MTGRLNKKLGEILIEDGLLSSAQLDEALAYQKDNGGLIGQILIDLKFIAEDHLTSALGKQFRIPYVPLKSYVLNSEIAELLKPEFCLDNLLVAFDGDSKRICVAVADPLNQAAVDKVRETSQRTPQVFISRISEIRDAIFSLYHEKT